MPPSRLPTVSDLPAALYPILHPSTTASSGAPTPRTTSNIIVFLPGLGDSSINFSTFASALNLPESLTLTLQPAHPLPFPLGPGFHWSDDLHIDTNSNSSQDSPLDSTESGFTRSQSLVAQQVISDVLLTQCGYRPDEVHLLGYGQGGSLALTVPLHPSLQDLSLGGVISIDGSLPLSTPLDSIPSTSTSTSTSPSPSEQDNNTRPTKTTTKNTTPILLTGSSQTPLFFPPSESSSKITRVRDRYTHIEIAKWKRKTAGMPSCRDEVLPLMKFWARRLRSHRGVPEGMLQIS